MNPAFAIAEVIWLICGSNRSAFLNYFNAKLPKFAGEGDTYHGAYGHRLRHHLGYDQLDRAFRVLSKRNDSRQVVLQIWDGKIDSPSVDGVEAAPDIPCNVVSMLKMRSGRLEWTQIMRSNDLFRGLPYNIVQFTTLQEVLAGWLKVEVGNFDLISDSLHLYEDSLPTVSKSVPIRAEANTDSLALERRDSDEVFQRLYREAERIAHATTSVKEIEGLPLLRAFPQAYTNILRVLCAEGARKRKRPEIARAIMGDCTNPAFVQLYDRWLTRWSKPSRENAQA
jgi:thymidylate synthase